MYVGPHHAAEVKSRRVTLSHSGYFHNVLRLIIEAFKGKKDFYCPFRKPYSFPPSLLSAQIFAANA